MAAITTAGKVTAKEGTEAVTVREFGNGGKIAKFNMVDSEYYYAKNPDDKVGQFYTCEVSGKQADIVVDRLQRGDRSPQAFARPLGRRGPTPPRTDRIKE